MSRKAKLFAEVSVVLVLLLVFAASSAIADEGKGFGPDTNYMSVFGFMKMQNGNVPPPLVADFQSDAYMSKPGQLRVLGFKQTGKWMPMSEARMAINTFYQ